MALDGRLFISHESTRRCTEAPDVSRTQYCTWSDDSMVKAMSAVEQGVSVRKASELFGVPRSTLHDRVSGSFLSLVSAGI